MIHRTRMPSLEQTYELFDDPRYLESRGPDHEAYSAMANRLQNFHISPETWPMPEPFQLGRPLAPRLPVGAGGVNRPQDVADLSDGLLSLGGLGLSGWLPRTHVPTSKLNAAIAGFQRLNNLTPDGRVNPDGPTVKVLNGYLPIPQVGSVTDGAPMYEAAALNPESQPPLGRPITAPGMGDEALARSRAEEARAEAAFEAERRAEDPFGDIFGGGRRYQRNHIDDMVDSFEAESRAQLEREALAGLDRNSMMMEVGYRPNEQAVWGAMGVPGETFRKMIADRERSYEPGENPNAFGEYQLTKGGLIDIKMMRADGTWTGKHGITSTKQFFDNIDVQNLAFTEYMSVTEGYVHEGGDFDAFDYRGQEIDGVLGIKFSISPVGMMAAAHRWGAGGLRDYIKHLRKNNWVSNFDEFDDENKKKYLAIETRLREFENAPYSD